MIWYRPKPRAQRMLKLAVHVIILATVIAAFGQFLLHTDIPHTIMFVLAALLLCWWLVR